MTEVITGVSKSENKLGGKVRVYELAKEVGIDSKALLLLLQAKGYPIRNYTSTIDGESSEEIRQFFRNSDPAKIRELVDLGHEI